jgi:sugar lactone lactonase YvrE
MFEGHCAANKIFILSPPYSRSHASDAAFAQPCGNAIAFDTSNGTLGVTSGAVYGKLSIRIYRPPYSSSSVPATTFTPRGIVHPRSAAWDAAGDLWVADDEANRIFEFRPPFSATTQAAKTLTVATQPAGLAIDPQTRLMFVTDLGGGRTCAKTSCRIDVLDAPYTGKPIATLTFPHAQPFVAAVDGSGRLFAGIDRGGASSATIDVYERPVEANERAAFALHPGGPVRALAFDDRGNLFAQLLDSGVVEFVAPITGTRSAPSAILGCPKGLNCKHGWAGLAFGP